MYLSTFLSFRVWFLRNGGAGEGKQVEFQAQSCLFFLLLIQDMALLEGGSGGGRSVQDQAERCLWCGNHDKVRNTLFLLTIYVQKRELALGGGGGGGPGYQATTCFVRTKQNNRLLVRGAGGGCRGFLENQKFRVKKWALIKAYSSIFFCLNVSIGIEWLP